VALTLSDAFCVDRWRDEFLQLMRSRTVDFIFANEAELHSLYQTSDFDTAIVALRADIDVAVVTRSEKGCLVVGPDGIEAVPAFPVERVVDTTGAGDLFAAGFLSGLARGADDRTCGRLGALAAAVFAGLLVVPLLRAPSVREHSQVEPPPNPVASAVPAPAAAQLGEGEHQKATGSAGSAPRKAAPPASIASDYASTAKTAVPAASDAAAAPPASPNRSSGRVATPSGDRGALLRGAAVSGDLAAVQALLRFAPEADARDGSGRTALMLAILNGHADVVEALLAHGADVNAADAAGVRALQMARAEGNESIVDSLLRAGAH